jgi:hypothetical protein
MSIIGRPLGNRSSGILKVDADGNSAHSWIPRSNSHWASSRAPLAEHSKLAMVLQGIPNATRSLCFDFVHPDENRRNIVSGSIALVDAHHRDWLRIFFPFKKAGCDTISI